MQMWPCQEAPSRLSISDNLAGWLEEQPERIQAHLARCSACRGGFELLSEWRRRLRHPSWWVATEWRCEAELARLLAAAQNGRHALVAAVEAQWGVSSRLLEEAWALRFAAPVEAEAIAVVAELVASGLDRSYYGKHCYDQQARALAHLGNLRRVNGDIDGGLELLERARTLVTWGTGDRHLTALVRRLAASALRSAGKVAAAERLAARSAEGFAEAQDPREAALSRMVEAGARAAQGDLDGALATYLGRLGDFDLLDEATKAISLYNTTQLLLTLGKVETAVALATRLPRSEGLFLDTWHRVEGWRFHLVGLPEESRAAFEQAFAGCCQRGACFEAAAVLLDQVAVALEVEGIAAARRVATEQVLRLPEGLRPWSAQVLQALLLLLRGSEVTRGCLDPFRRELHVSEAGRTGEPGAAQPGDRQDPDEANQRLSNDPAC